MLHLIGLQLIGKENKRMIIYLTLSNSYTKHAILIQHDNLGDMDLR